MILYVLQVVASHAKPSFYGPFSVVFQAISILRAVECGFGNKIVLEIMLKVLLEVERCQYLVLLEYPTGFPQFILNIRRYDIIKILEYLVVKKVIKVGTALPPISVQKKSKSTNRTVVIMSILIKSGY